MQKERIVSIAIICLSISIIISANIIAKGMKTYGEHFSTGLYNASQRLGSSLESSANSNDSSTVYRRSTYDLPTAASYLGISESKLKGLAANEHSGIPYIKIGSDYVFSKNALDKWLETVRFEIN